MKKSVVLIPEWIESALLANGISLSKLEEYGYGQHSNYTEYIKSIGTLSAYDLAELYICNSKLFRNLFGVYNSDKMGSFINVDVWSIIANNINIDKEDTGVYINLLNNLDNNSILMRDTNVVDKPKYSFKQQDNTLFVVLHTGFSNFAVTGEKVNKDIFIRDLIDAMFKGFGEEDALKHSITEAYVRNR